MWWLFIFSCEEEKQFNQSRKAERNNFEWDSWTNKTNENEKVFFFPDSAREHGDKFQQMRVHVVINTNFPVWIFSCALLPNVPKTSTWIKLLRTFIGEWMKLLCRCCLLLRLLSWGSAEVKTWHAVSHVCPDPCEDLWPLRAQTMTTLCQGSVTREQKMTRTNVLNLFCVMAESVWKWGDQNVTGCWSDWWDAEQSAKTWKTDSEQTSADGETLPAWQKTLLNTRRLSVSPCDEHLIRFF